MAYYDLPEFMMRNMDPVVEPTMRIILYRGVGILKMICSVARPRTEKYMGTLTLPGGDTFGTFIAMVAMGLKIFSICVKLYVM